MGGRNGLTKEMKLEAKLLQPLFCPHLLCESLRIVVTLGFSPWSTQRSFSQASIRLSVRVATGNGQIRLRLGLWPKRYLKA